MLIAQWIVYIAIVHAAIGLLFAVWFVWAGVGRIDPAAGETGLGFRVLILPGVVAVWPLLLARVVRGRRFPPTEKNAHRLAATLRRRAREGQ